MLDYGYKSACCKAPIKVGFKKIKNTTRRKVVWVCTKCGTRDINIISNEEVKNQTSTLTEE